MACTKIPKSRANTLVVGISPADVGRGSSNRDLIRHCNRNCSHNLISKTIEKSAWNLLASAVMEQSEIPPAPWVCDDNLVGTIHHPNEWFHVSKTHLLESLDGFVASRFQNFQIHPVFWMKFLSPITDPIVFLASKHTDVFFRFHPQNLGIFHQKWGFGGCPTDPNWSAKMEVFHRSFMLDSWVSKQQKSGCLSKEKRDLPGLVNELT
jgi:hypothetical protein